MRGQVWSGNGSDLLKKQKEFCISMVYVVHVCDMFLFLPSTSAVALVWKKNTCLKFRNTWKFSVRSFIFVKK